MTKSPARMAPLWRTSAAWPLLALAGLAACGGGGGSSPPPPPPPPVNGAPVFTSAGTASVAENSSGAVYQAAASDPNGNALTFAIAGGADAGRFTITPAGQLSFAAAPNFDLPADADGDNVYQLQLTVSDGQLSATLPLAVTVTNSREGIAARRVGTGFTDPVAIGPVAGDLLLVAERGGAIYRFNPQTGARTLLVQIANVGGVTALAAAPDHATSGAFLVMYTNADGLLIVQDFFRIASGATVPSSAALLAVPAPDYQGGGWIGYEAGGDIFIATGDAGGTRDPAGSAQSPSSFLGKMLRLVRNPDPFAGASPDFYFETEIGRGLHQPNGASFLGNNLIFVDRGENLADEINVLPLDGMLRNFGWAFKEGTSVVGGTPPAGLVDPRIEVLRGTGVRMAQGLVGGALGPSAIASLREQYVFADRGGAIFTVNAAPIQQGSTIAAASLERRDADFAPDAGSINAPVAVAPGPLGTLYILDADGEIFRIDPA